MISHTNQQPSCGNFGARCKHREHSLLKSPRGYRCRMAHINSSSRPTETILITINPNPPPVTQGNYDEAGPLYRRSLAITEKAVGPDHADVAISLNNLAKWLYRQVINYFAWNISRVCLKALLEINPYTLVGHTPANSSFPETFSRG